MLDDQHNVIAGMPVNREYDFEEDLQTDVPRYIQNDDELDRMQADIRVRKITGKLPRFLLGGPTGCGKTHCARYLASHLDAPLITIQGKYSLHEADLLGSPALIDDQTVWNDGPLTRALLASQEGPVVLLLDEVNRIRPEAKGVLFSALDDRGCVELDGRGGETVQGDPQNLIVIATINEGAEYVTQRLDKAEQRRFGNKFSITYLGLIEVEKEARLVSDQTPISLPLAIEIVKTANDIRTQARNENQSAINAGVPTAMVLSWARSAFAYHDAGLGDPAVEAARDAVLRPFYDENHAAQEQAMQIVKDRLSGIPVGKEAVESWRADEQRIVKGNEYA